MNQISTDPESEDVPQSVSGEKKFMFDYDFLLSDPNFTANLYCICLSIDLRLSITKM